MLFKIFKNVLTSLDPGFSESDVIHYCFLLYKYGGFKKWLQVKEIKCKMNFRFHIATKDRRHKVFLCLRSLVAMSLGQGCIQQTMFNIDPL